MVLGKLQGEQAAIYGGHGLRVLFIGLEVEVEHNTSHMAHSRGRCKMWFRPERVCISSYK